MTSEQEAWAETEEDDNEGPENSGRLPLLVGIAVLALFCMCGLAAFLVFQEPVRSLRPFRGEADGIELVVDGEPMLVTFAELSEDAAEFQNKRIRVTGFYLPLQPPKCPIFNGPIIPWSLVSEGLQLNAKGFELPLSIVAPGTTLTVEGIWRQYVGPVGCGKEPEQGNVWYLQVERIIQPNPLVASTADPQAYLLEGVVTPMFPTPGPTRTPRLPGDTDTPVPAMTATTMTTVTAVTPVEGTATATATATQTATPGFVGTSTPRGTPGRGTPTVTATPTGTITPATPTPPGGVPPTVPGLTPYPGSTVPPPPGATVTPPGY